MSLRRFIRRLVICARRALAVTMVTAVLWWRWPIPLGPLPAVASFDEAQATAAPAVIIEEIAWAGSSVSIADEWIELANLGEATATVAGWALRGAGESGRTIFLPPDAVIAPRSVYLVANYADEDAKSALAVSVDLATTTVSLSNSALGLELVDENGATMDRAGDGSAPGAGSSSPKTAMLRVSSTSNGELAPSWTNATASQNFDASVADLGSPGVCDLCASVPAHSSADLSTGVLGTQVEASSGEALPPLEEITNATSPAADSTTVMIETTDQSVETSPPSSIEDPSPIETSDSADNAATTDSVTTPVVWPDDGLTTTDYAATTTEEAVIESATDTEPVVDAATTTVIGNTGVTTTEEVAPATTEPLVDAATTTLVETETDESPAPLENLEQTSQSEATQVPVSSPLSAPRPLLPLVITLNEAMSNPASGPEWVELALGDSNATATDRALELWDAAGKFMTIAAGTPVNAPGFLTVTLANARLNNGGDRLELRESSQGIVDATTIPELEDGMAWARRASDDSWMETVVATPGAANNVPLPMTAVPPASSQAGQITSPLSPMTRTPLYAVIPTSTGKTPAKPKTAKTTASKNVTSSKSASSAAGAKTTGTKTTAAKTAATSEATASASATTKTATSKPISKTSSPAPILYPFSSMFENDANGVRVRVTGYVGSVPRLLGATHAFILLGEDGRGVIVYLPKHLNVPALGSTVRVMGTLTTTYKGPEIRMKTTDVWTTVATLPAPKTRSVDLLMPGAEDAWSLTTSTGTVKEVKARSFVLDADGVDVQVNIPPAVKYRPERLMKGDTVRVTALLDLRRDAPSLLPRTPDEIEIVKHVPSSVASVTADKKSALPDWTPFGAAAGAVVLTGAAKRLRELLRRRRLEALARAAITTAA